MPRKIVIPNLDDFLRRYTAGESENKLAKEIGISRPTFRKRLIDAGITPRTQSESERIKWQNMTTGQRERQVMAAHKASKGRMVPFSELCLRARMREGNIHYNVSPDEIILADWLSDIGINTICNYAVGPYNCDLGTFPIIVEIWGGNWHPKPIDIKRTKYILDAGYWLLYIDVDERRGYPLMRNVTEYIVTLLETSRRYPTMTRQYWMIRGNGELIFKRFNGDDISLIPPFTAGRDPSNGQYKRISR